METKDKIAKLCKTKGIKRKIIIEYTGANKSTVSTWFNGISKPNGPYLAKLSKLLQCDSEWLMDNKLEWNSGLTEGDFKTSNDYIDLPYYKDIKLSAGDGAELPIEETDHTLKFRRDWLKQKGFDANHLCVVICTGESMEPTLRDKDIVLINLVDKKIEDGRVYAINYSGDAKVKRLFKNFDESVSIRSDNPRFKEEFVSKEQLQSDSLRIIGRAVWHGGDL